MPCVGLGQFRDSIPTHSTDAISIRDSTKQNIGLITPASLSVQFLTSEVGWAIPMLVLNANGKRTQSNQGPSLNSVFAFCIALVAPAIITDVTLSALHWETGRLWGGIVGTTIGGIALVLINPTNKTWLDFGITSVLGTMLFYDLAGLLWPKE